MHQRLRSSQAMLIVVIPLIAVGLVMGLFAAVRLGAVQPEASTPLSSVPQGALPAATVAPIAPAAEQPAPPPAPGAMSQEPAATTVTTSTLAVVNDRLLDRDRFELARRVDSVMADLTGVAPAEPAQLLEQLVNGELVWQAVQAEGSAPSAGQAELAGFLERSGFTQAELAARLAAAGVEWGQFMTYFSRLLTVDSFAQAKAATLGLATPGYIAQLQRAAHISFGPAAQVALAAGGEPVRATYSVTAAITASITTAITAAEGASTAAAEVKVSASPGVTAPAATPLATAVAPAAEARGSEHGQLAPPFHLEALNSMGNAVGLGDFAGKPLVVSFWTTWCPYCLRQTPVLVAAHAAVSDSVSFVGVNVQEGEDVVLPYVNEHGITYPVMLDRDGAVAAAYGVLGFPMTYFLDGAGRIVAQHAGQLSPEQLKDYLNRPGISSR